MTTPPSHVTSTSVEQPGVVRARVTAGESVLLLVDDARQLVHRHIGQEVRVRGRDITFYSDVRVADHQGVLDSFRMTAHRVVVVLMTRRGPHANTRVPRIVEIGI